MKLKVRLQQKSRSSVSVDVRTMTRRVSNQVGSQREMDLDWPVFPGGFRSGTYAELFTYAELLPYAELLSYGCEAVQR